MRVPFTIVPISTLTSTLALAIMIASLPGCSAQKQDEATSIAADAASQSAGPAISTAVAPGVAFAYNFAFSLPARAIPTVQQDHAEACQKLGPTRCRVTGVTFDQRGEDDASGRLDFLLAPDLAQAFANGAIAAVERAEGKLDTAQVNGENAGDAIRLSQRSSAAIDAEMRRIEARLAAPGLANSERAELQRQLGNLAEQQRGAVVDRKAREESIASTPVSFAYASQGLASSGNTLGRAASASWSSAETLLAILALALGVAAPWAVLAGLGVLAWRALRRRHAIRSDSAATAATP